MHVMRHQRKLDIVLEHKSNNKGKDKDKDKDKDEQVELHVIDENEPVKSWEYAVLVSNAACGLEQIGQLCRDRADCVDLEFCQNGLPMSVRVLSIFAAMRRSWPGRIAGTRWHAISPPKSWRLVPTRPSQRQLLLGN